MDAIATRVKYIGSCRHDLSQITLDSRHDRDQIRKRETSTATIRDLRSIKSNILTPRRHDRTPCTRAIKNERTLQDRWGATAARDLGCSGHASDRRHALESHDPVPFHRTMGRGPKTSGTDQPSEEENNGQCRSTPHRTQDRSEGERRGTINLKHQKQSLKPTKTSL